MDRAAETSAEASHKLAEAMYSKTREAGRGRRRAQGRRMAQARRQGGKAKRARKKTSSMRTSRKSRIRKTISGAAHAAPFT